METKINIILVWRFTTKSRAYANYLQLILCRIIYSNLYLACQRERKKLKANLEYNDKVSSNWTYLGQKFRTSMDNSKVNGVSRRKSKQKRKQSQISLFFLSNSQQGTNTLKGICTFELMRPQSYIFSERFQTDLFNISSLNL